MRNCVDSSPNVEIVALGDLFQDRIDAGLNLIRKNGDKDWSSSQPWQYADKVKVTRETCFTGFDAYQKVINSGVDLVILATSPHFRPMHLKAAIEAGKHVFTEKPVAVDPVGIRSVFESSETARQKGLAIVAGAQRRHDPKYIEIMKRVHNGKPLNEGKQVAESTMTAILGRMSAYTGRAIKWDWAMKASELDLTPPTYKFGNLPVGPVAMPGKTQLI